MKCGLTHEEFDGLYNRLITASLYLGFLLGSLILSPLLKRGRNIWLVVFGGVAIIGTGMTLVEEIWTIIVGRFIHGFALSVFMGVSSRMTDETVPPHLIGFFGLYVNISYLFGVMLVMLFGLGLPQGAKISDEELQADEFWRVCYGMPILCNILGVVLLLSFFKEESLIYLVKEGIERREEALSLIKKIHLDEEPDKVYAELESQDEDESI